jgi:Flp pilus assembly protein TadD
MTVQQYYEKGLAHLKQENYEQALLSFDKALAQEMYNATIISDKAVVLFHLGKKVDALALLDQAQNLEPQNPYRYSSRAFIKESVGDIEGAIEDYKKAITLDPEDMVAHNNLGLLEEKLGYKEASKRNFERADDLAKKFGFDFKNTELADSEEIEQPQEASDNQVINKKADKDKTALSTLSEEKVSINYFLKISKQVFSSKEVFQEFLSFVMKKKIK